MSGFKHCDDYIEDKTQPECLRKFLAYARAPGHGHDLGEKPLLFATYKEPDGVGGRKGRIRRVRVVMASRYGDVGITTDLTRDMGYDLRVAVESLADFSGEFMPPTTTPNKGDGK